MRTLGNILWFILGGWWNFLLYASLGVLFCITIIGIPVGKALFQYAKLMALPFGKEIIKETELKGKENVSAIRRVGGVIANIVWLPFGIASFIANIGAMLLCFVSIILIPVGIVIAKSCKFLLWPVGAKVVTKETAEMARMSNMMRNTMGNVSPMAPYPQQQAPVNPAPYPQQQVPMNPMPYPQQQAVSQMMSAGTNPSYTELSRVIPEYYCPKSKILIDTIILSKDNANVTYLNLDFSNIGNDNIIAIYFKVKGYGIAGESLGEQEYNLIDLNIAPNTKFHSAELALFNNSIRKVEIVLTQTVNSSYSVARFEEGDTLVIPQSVSIYDSLNNDIVELMGLTSDERYLFMPLEENLWVCTCGHIGYNNCSYCGRDASQSLKNTDSDVLGRITNTIECLLGDIDYCNSIDQLNIRKNKIGRAVELLNANNVSEELLNRCNEALDRIEIKKGEIEQKTRATKAKMKKGLILTFVCVGIIAATAFGVWVITQLPPSNIRIKSDAKMFISEEFEDAYTIQNIKIEKDRFSEGYRADANITAKNPQNDDIVEITAVLRYFDKKYGRYVNSSSVVEEFTLIPGHEVTEQDEFPYPGFKLKNGDDVAYIDEEEVKTMSAEGCLNLEYNIMYSDIVVTDNRAEVPMTVQVEYFNSAADTEVTGIYIYDGDYGWRTESYTEVQLNPTGILLDDSLVKQLVAEGSIEYWDYDYYGELVMLSGEHLILDDFEVEYFDGFTRAELNGQVTWDNSRDRLVGTIGASFELENDRWSLSYMGFYDTSEQVRYREVPDNELITILDSIISAHCSENTNVNNIEVVSKEVYDYGMMVEVTYNSEDDIYLLKNRVSMELVNSLADGYTCSWVQDENVEEVTLKEELNQTISVDFRLRCDNADPIGVPYNGSAQLQMNIDQNCNVSISGYIGSLGVNLSGRVVYPNDRLVINKYKQSVYVDYTYMVTVSKTIKCEVTPVLNFSDGKLTGKISYIEDRSFGFLGGFEIILE